MNRSGFLKRLGALAVTAMVAEPILEALVAPHSIANGDKVMYYKVFYGGKEHTYWMWWSDYQRMKEYQKEMDAKLYESLWTGKFS